LDADARIGEEYDVAVIGAGPAGMTAAATCARAGLSTVLFDEQSSPGGQIYRGITRSPLDRQSILGDSYRRGAALAQALAESGAQYVPGATVWSLTREREIAVSVNGASRIVRARRVIVCTGTLERPFPIAGWTLPGVMTAGAAQSLLKSSGVVASGRVVFAGCGPLLWLTASQYLEAGVRVEAVLETTPRENYAAALPHLPAFLISAYRAKGLALVRKVKRAVRVVTGVTALGAHGDSRVREVAYGTGDGETRIACDVLLVHQGVVANVNLAMAAGVEHRWDDAQLCWTPVLDRDGATSIDGVAIAGDGARIGGAEAAEYRGTLAALAAIRALGGKAPQDEPSAARTGLARALRGRAFLDVLYRPPKAFRVPSGETIVCRCEEVTARQIGDTVALGCPGPNQMKALLRCGMGPCQGRLCGLTVTELIADARGITPQQVGYYRLRPPIKPITVGELAEMPTNEAARNAVERG
jgi:NADPH-dependent 2,4-dienoyl-CoA reductase/sulfur reductase-like enzyme